MPMSDAPMVHPETRAEWRAWLEANHTTGTGVWLVGWRKGHGPRIDYEHAVEEALCFGWIDGQAGSLDERRSRQWYAPRKPTSGWASTNKARVERLVAEGKMRPAGLAAIERAKANGSWSLLDGPEQGIVPNDLASALDERPSARSAFDGFPKSARQMMLTWVAQAKRPETRAARIREIAERAARNERAGPAARSERDGQDAAARRRQ